MLGFNKSCQINLHSAYIVHSKYMYCYYCFSCCYCSHERVLEAITEEAEKRDIERFQPLLAGMNNQNIALKVHTHMYIHTLTITYCILMCELV